MTREEYEIKIDEKLKAVKEVLMSEFKEEKLKFDGWNVGDKYYVRFDDRQIRTETIGLDSEGKIYEYDVFNITHGYAKRTAEEVQFQIERDAVLYELSKFAEPKDAVWNIFKNHYYIYWDCTAKRICTSFNIENKHNDIYFASKEDAEKAIAEVGEERIKKYYLEVEE